MAYNFQNDRALSWQVYRRLYSSSENGSASSPISFHLYVYLHSMDYIKKTVTVEYFLRATGNKSNVQTITNVNINLNGHQIYSADSLTIGNEGSTEVLLKQDMVELEYSDYGTALKIEGTGSAHNPGRYVNHTFVSSTQYYPDGDSANGWNPNHSFYALRQDPFFIYHAGKDYGAVYDVPEGSYGFDVNKARTFKMCIPYVETETQQLRLYFPTTKNYDASTTTSVWEWVLNNPTAGTYFVDFAFSNQNIRALNDAIMAYNAANGASAIGLPTSSLVVFVDRQGDYVVGAYADIYLQTTKNVPIISGTVKDVRPVTLALTGDENVLIRYASHAKVTIEDLMAVGGATITEYGITHGNETMLNVDTYTFEMVQNNYFKLHATDSKKNTTVEEIETPMVNYVIPSAVVKGGVVSGNGEMTLKVFGSCFTGSFGVQSNEVFVYYRYKEQNASDDEFTDWVPLRNININAEANTYTTNTIVTGLDYEKAYVFQAQIADILYTIVSSDYIAVSIPIFDWSASDFNFNVPVYVQGKQIGGENTILWAGNDVMAADGVATLSEPISAQTHGIVLVFSNASGDVSWNTAYVPKEMIYYYNGGGHTFLMAINAGLSTFGAKYLYIADEAITGHATNQEAGTSASAIKFSNANYVLRYVIGV